VLGHVGELEKIVQVPGIVHSVVKNKIQNVGIFREQESTNGLGILEGHGNVRPLYFGLLPAHTVRFELEADIDASVPVFDQVLAFEANNIFPELSIQNKHNGHQFKQYLQDCFSPPAVDAAIQLFQESPFSQAMDGMHNVSVNGINNFHDNPPFAN
jgi:hypothetical protein